MLTARRRTQGIQEGELAGARFDRFGGPAWALALWLVKDEQLAEQIVVAAFAQAGPGRDDDSRVLSDVRRRGLAAATRQARESDTTASGAIAAFPEPQRAIIELVVFGQLGTAAVASATELPASEVLRLIGDTMRTLRPFCEA